MIIPYLSNRIKIDHNRDTKRYILNGDLSKFTKDHARCSSVSSVSTCTSQKTQSVQVIKYRLIVW